MNCPKIRIAKAIDHHILAIEFNNGERRWYDITHLLKNEMFLLLQNPDFF